MGYVALAPPFGGSTYAIANKLGGNRINLLQSLGDLLQPVLNEIMYHGSRGMPSMLMMMPYAGIWGKEHVSGMQMRSSIISSNAGDTGSSSRGAAGAQGAQCYLDLGLQLALMCCGAAA
jgi:hypothetical protein